MSIFFIDFEVDGSQPDLRARHAEARKAAQYSELPLPVGDVKAAPHTPAGNLRQTPTRATSGLNLSRAVLASSAGHLRHEMSRSLVGS